MPGLAVLLCVSLLGSAAGSASGGPLFAAAFLSFDTGRAPQSVAVGDLNGDGKQDLMTANFGDNTVSVLLGNGDGTFGAQADYAAGSRPTSVAIADVSGDGKLDLATANSSSNAVSLFLGNGDGTFGAKVDYATGNSPRSVAIGDLSGDGRPDLAVANLQSNTVSVFLGNGDGTFQTKVDYGTGVLPLSVVIGDVSGEGNPDLAVANATSNTVSVLLGNGDGTFGTKVDYAAGAQPRCVAMGDLNGDGKPDLAVVNRIPSTVSVLLGNGDGTFGAKADYETGFWPNFVVIGDVSGDGRPDLSVANFTSKTVSVRLGNGDGSFGARVDYDTGGFSQGNGPFSLAMGDVNGDGRPDLATANADDSSVSVLLGNGDGSFGMKVAREMGIGTRSVAIGDVSGDGNLDVVTANSANGTSNVSVLLGNGDGSFGARVDYETGSGSYSVAICDVSGDGKPDLAVANSLSNTVSVLLGNGDGSFGARVDYGTGGEPTSVAIGDVSGDGKPDLVIANSEYPASIVSVLLGNGDGTFAAKVDYAAGTGPRSVAIGDVDGDGSLDLVVANYFSNTVSVSILLGNGDGTFGAAVGYWTGSYANFAAVADISGDGKLDLVTSNASNTVSVALGNGDGSFGARVDYGISGGPGPESVAIGDVNGDGKPDLAVANSGSMRVSVLLGNGDGTFERQGDYGAGNLTLSVAIGDVNGDGKPDLAAANYNSSTVSILMNIGSRPATLAVALDLDPDVVNLKSHAPWLTAYIEPSGFDPASIDLSTVRLAGSVPPWPKPGLIGDHDANNAPDLRVRFSREALDPLLTLGVNALEVTGSLVTGEAFKGTAEIRVIDAPDMPLSASVAPNPLNPVGVLRFTMTKPGSVTVRMFDLQGRLVRTLIEAPFVPAGAHEAGIDGRGERGQSLASGVYFYTVEAAGQLVRGRVAILK